MKATDFVLTNLNAWVVAQLQAKATLRSLMIVPDNRGDFKNQLDKAYGAFGIAGFVANADGQNFTPQAASLHDNTVFRIVLIENVNVNRNRAPVSTVSPVVTDEDRRALPNLHPYDCVQQTSASQDFQIEEAWKYRLLAADAAQATNWAPVLNIYQAAELIERVLHGLPISVGNTCVWRRRMFGVPVKGLFQPIHATCQLEFGAVLDYGPMVIA